MQIRLTTAIYPALEMLPTRMESTESVVMMLAIGMQESRFEHRRQIRGPARGFWQFEHGGGVVGVMTHGASSENAQQVASDLVYPYESETIYNALEHNDVLAACFARLLLWTDPRPLPTYDDGAQVAWDYYLRNWRPGKAHPETWARFWDLAWSHFR